MDTDKLIPTVINPTCTFFGMTKPETGSLMYEYCRHAQEFIAECCIVVGFEVVVVSPSNDHDRVTTHLSA